MDGQYHPASQHSAEFATAFGMLKPTRKQLFWARGWPWRLWFWFAPVVGMLFCLRANRVGVGEFLRWPDALWAVLLSIVGYGFGLGLAVVLAGPIIGPRQDARVVANGGPFTVGDTVQIIAGRFSGRVGRVYLRGPSEMVYVDVGPEAKARHQDLFGQTKLVRVVPEADDGSRATETPSAVPPDHSEAETAGATTPPLPSAQ